MITGCKIDKTCIFYESWLNSFCEKVAAMVSSGSRHWHEKADVCHTLASVLEECIEIVVAGLLSDS